MIVRTDKLIKETVEDLRRYMASPEGKHSILNPDDEKPILTVGWFPYEFEKEVKYRVHLYIDKYLHSKFHFFEEIYNDLKSFNQKTSQEHSNLQKEWTECMHNHRITHKNINYEIDSVLEYPLMAVVGTLGLAVITILSPVLVPLYFLKNQVRSKRQLVDEEYDKLRPKIFDQIEEIMIREWGQPLESKVNNVTKKLTEDLSESQTKKMNDLKIAREKILASRSVYLRLQEKVTEMETEAFALHTTCKDTKSN